MLCQQRQLIYIRVKDFILSSDKLHKKRFSTQSIALILILVIIIVLFLIMSARIPNLIFNQNSNDLVTGDFNSIDTNSFDSNILARDTNSQNNVFPPLVNVGEDTNTVEEINPSISLCLDKCKTLRASCAEEGMELRPDATGCYQPRMEVVTSDGNCETNCFVQ